MLIQDANKESSNLVDYWEEIKAAIDSYPGIFPEEVTEDDFIFFYMAFASRAFGSSMPTNVLVPFADNLNHANTTTYFSLFHRDIEKGPKKKPKQPEEPAEEPKENGELIWEMYDYETASEEDDVDSDFDENEDNSWYNVDDEDVFFSLTSDS